MTVSDYILLPPGSQLPDPPEGPFRVCVIIEESVTDEWRVIVSRWLVDSGCLYMCAWGEDCSKWDDSVDYANLEDFAFGAVPDDRFVMTTWHSDEPLTEALFYLLFVALHPTTELRRIVLLHIANLDRGCELLSLCERIRLAGGPVEI